MIIERLKLIEECLSKAELTISNTHETSSSEEKEKCINDVHTEIIKSLNYLKRR